MEEKPNLSYEELTDGARFREQYRFAFSIAIIATVFVLPSSNVVGEFFKYILYFSAFFAALYLISSAARVKYTEPGRLYEVIYIGERFRMLMYDLSLHVFAAGLMFFIAVIITGLIDSMPGVYLGPIMVWVVWAVSLFATGVMIMLGSVLSKKWLFNKKKSLPRV